MTEKRRATPANSEGRARIARLRRRLEYLKKRITLKVQMNREPASYDLGEASALEWSLEQLDRLARLERAARALRRIADRRR